MQPLKMCVEKSTKHDLNHLQELKNISTSSNQYDKLSAAFYTAKLWPNNSTITVGFLEEPPANLERTSLSDLKNKRDVNGNALEIDPLQYDIDKLDIISAVKKIVNDRINPIVNLKFIFVDNVKDAQIRISFNPGSGAWSLLGTDCLNEKDPNEATMNLGWFDVPTTIHEFGHALGLIHEHQNPKDNLIEWDKKKVYSWAKQTQGWDEQTTYHNIIEKYSSAQINGSKFDPESIMLYFFPGSLTTNNKGTNQNLKLSEYDVAYLNSVYSNSPMSPEQFYKDVYNKNIDPSILSSLKNINKYKQTTDSDTTTSKSHSTNIIIGISIFVGVAIILFIIIRSFSKKATKPTYINKIA